MVNSTVENGYYDNLILRSVSVTASFTFNGQKSSLWTIKIKRKWMQLFLSWENKLFSSRKNKVNK